MAKRVMTVLGSVDPSTLGSVLPHEHVMSTFGAPATDHPGYDPPRLMGVVVPYLRRIRDLGFGTVLDCTADRFGRDPALLRDISRESGVQIVTNTGCYAAARDRYVPEHALHETAEELAAQWTAEWRDGIRGTGIRPGFIKIAVDDGPLSALDRKIVRAAALASHATGLAIQNHLGDNLDAAGEILAVLESERLPATSWVWVHAHGVAQTASLRHALERGAWVSLDGLRQETADHILAHLLQVRAWGHLGQVLLSHDGDTYDRDGQTRPYHYLMTDFLPRLRGSGFTEQEIRVLTAENPARAFSVEL